MSAAVGRPIVVIDIRPEALADSAKTIGQVIANKMATQPPGAFGIVLIGSADECRRFQDEVVWRADPPEEWMPEAPDDAVEANPADDRRTALVDMRVGDLIEAGFVVQVRMGPRDV